MGIRSLGKFLSVKCGPVIPRQVYLSSLSGKTIVIDTSIYLYKFAGNDSLLADMYLFIAVLRESGICPIFIFDGKPNDDKYKIIKKRGEQKRIALEEYNTMKLDANIKPYELSQARKKCVYLTRTEIQKVKDLLDAYGVTYYTAVHESDPLCAYLVQTGKAWACMSDDMDMFAYGCPRILRNTHLMAATTMLFDLDIILLSLHISLPEFRQLTLLHGNDHCEDITLPWNSMDEVWSIFRTWKLTTENITTLIHIDTPVVCMDNTPVGCVDTPVVCVDTPVGCVDTYTPVVCMDNTPVVCIDTPVVCMDNTPVVCVDTPVVCLDTPVGTNHHTCCDFYIWLLQNKYITVDAFDALNIVYRTFETENVEFQASIEREYTDVNLLSHIIDQQKTVNREQIQNIMQEVGFIFV
jgi:hypothetical protein